MRDSGLLTYVPLLLLLSWAAAEDLHARRIPNWLSFGLMLGGLLQSFASQGTVAPGQALLGLLAGGGLLWGLFVLGAVGGGDVKLLAGVGAWLGPGLVFQVFLAEAIVGMLIVLAQAACQGRLWLLLRNSALLAVNLVHLGDVGIEHVSRTGQSCRSVHRPLPYAVPVLIGVILVLWQGWLPGR